MSASLRPCGHALTCHFRSTMYHQALRRRMTTDQEVSGCFRVCDIFLVRTCGRRGWIYPGFQPRRCTERAHRVERASIYSSSAVCPWLGIEEQTNSVPFCCPPPIDFGKAMPVSAWDISILSFGAAPCRCLQPMCVCVPGMPHW